MLLMYQDNTMEKHTRKHRDIEALEILDLVIRLQSLKSAAAVLNLPTSSVSAIISMLRKQFSDILYKKSNNKLLPTSLAIMLLDKLEEYRNKIEEKSTLPVKTQKRDNLIVCCESHVALCAVPLLMQLNVSKVAMTVIHLSRQAEGESLATELLNYNIDVVFNYKPIVHPEIITRFLFKEDVCIICRKNHPRLSDTIGVEEYLQEQHAIIYGEFLQDSYGNHDLNNQILTKNIYFHSENILDLLAAIETSEMISVIPFYLYQKLQKAFDIKSLGFKFDITSEIKSLYISYRRDKHECAHFRNIFELVR